ncbi:MAG: carbon monoxide dehydrogenase subunit G [Alphaproteobacteria bacterium]
MDMTGEYRIAAPREAVWAALNDPEVLRQAIPGCEEIDKSSPTEFTAKVTAKVGPVKARFGGKVTLSDLDPPNGYRISGEGQGGAAGFAKGGAEVKLSDDGDGTLLKYTVNANVGGKLAQIGSRLIDATARKMAEEFFGRFAELVAASAAAAPAAPPAAAEPPPPQPIAGEPTAAEPVAPAPDAPEAVALAAATADPEAVVAVPTPPPPPPAAAPAPVPAPARPAINPTVWIVGLIALAVLILLVFATPR